MRFQILTATLSVFFGFASIASNNCDSVFSDSKKNTSVLLRGKSADNLKLQLFSNQKISIKASELAKRGRLVSLRIYDSRTQTLYNAQSVVANRELYVSHHLKLWKSTVDNFYTLYINNDLKAAPQGKEILFNEASVMDMLHGQFMSKYNISKEDIARGFYTSKPDYNIRAALDADGHIQHLNFGELAKGTYQISMWTIDKEGIHNYEDYVFRLSE